MPFNIQRDMCVSRRWGRRLCTRGFCDCAAHLFGRNRCFMTLTILLVDSDADRAKALEDKLVLADFARVVRAQGHELAAAVERVRPDLVIVDMALPDRDALDDIK